MGRRVEVADKEQQGGTTIGTGTAVVTKTKTKTQKPAMYRVFDFPSLF